MKRILTILIFLGVTLALGACANRINRYYVGQCALPGHWFCGKVYDSRADCNNDRKLHDYQTSMGGSCYAGRADGAPDDRTM